MKISKYLLFALIYIIIQGIGMAIMYYGLDIVYGSPEMANVVLWVEIILVLLIVFYVRKYASWKEVGYGKIRWIHMLWIAPSLLMVLLSSVGILTRIDPSNLSSSVLLPLLTVGILTLLVGFAEETMFRGIVLRGALKGHGVFTAMLISAVLFALLHVVNIFGGLPVESLPNDQFSQLMYGLFMAPLALLIGNLTPLIIYHALNDFSVLGGMVVPAGGPQPIVFSLLPGFAYPVQIAMTVIAWVVVFVLWRRGMFKDKEKL